MDLDDQFLEREERMLVALDPVVDPADRPFRPVDVEGLIPVEVRPDDPVQVP